MNFKEILILVGTGVGALLLFGLTIFVHELGHFIAARRMKLIVEKFAIGFGPKIFGFTRNGVDYVINWLPLGGFVQLPQMAPMEMVEGKSDLDKENLPEASPFAKIITAAFGPLFSLLLSVILAVIVYYVGCPRPVSLDTTTIGYFVGIPVSENTSDEKEDVKKDVEKRYPAREAGLQLGDKIISINGKKAQGWGGNPNGVKESIALSIGETILIEVERPSSGERKTFTVRPLKTLGLDKLRTIGILPAQKNLKIDSVFKNSPAEIAGLKKGDEVVEVNGQKIYHSYAIIDAVEETEGKQPVQLTYLREGSRNTVTILPRHSLYKKESKMVPSERFQIGISWNLSETVDLHLTPWEQIQNSLKLVVKTLRAVTSPRSDVGVQHLSGPIGIYKSIRDLWTVDWRLVLYFGVILNVNLAFLNILPIPVLDGGHIVFSIIEAIRRRPMELKIMYVMQSAFFVLLIGLILFISYRDILRWNRDSTFETQAKEAAKQSKTITFEPVQNLGEENK